MKRMKKLMSCLLALAMILSLGVTALADEKTDYVTAEDELTGTTTNEGAMEANKISIILPTTTTGMYNMKLDPHDLIYRTNAARYSSVTFDYGLADSKPTQRLFFPTTATTATKDSAALEIVNKGMDDINVTVTLEVDAKGQDFDFVAADALDNSSEDAQMYLAVVSGTEKQAVTAPAADAEGTPYDPSAKVASGTYLKGATFTVLEESRITDAINTALSDVTINANYDGDDSGKVTFTLAGVDSELMEITGLPEGGITGNTNSGEQAVTLMINDNDDDFAKVEFKVDTAVTAPLNTATNAASIKLSGGGVKEPASEAVLTVKVEGSEDAFYEEWNTTSEKYVWTRKTTTDFPDTGYKKMSFNLTGNINTADAWDELSLTNDDAIGLTVIWKAEKYSADAGSGSGGGATNADPTVTLKGSTISSAAAVTYTVTYGSGTGARAKVNKIYCTRNGSPNEMTLQFNADKSEVTFTPTGMQFRDGTDWKIEFTDEDGSNAKTLDLPAFKA
jgi:hypothetical protein